MGNSTRKILRIGDLKNLKVIKKYLFLQAKNFRTYSHKDALQGKVMKNFHTIEFVFKDNNILWLKISYEDKDGNIIKTPEMGNLQAIDQDYQIETLQFNKGDSFLSMFAGFK